LNSQSSWLTIVEKEDDLELTISNKFEKLKGSAKSQKGGSSTPAQPKIVEQKGSAKHENEAEVANSQPGPAIPQQSDPKTTPFKAELEPELPSKSPSQAVQPPSKSTVEEKAPTYSKPTPIKSSPSPKPSLEGLINATPFAPPEDPNPRSVRKAPKLGPSAEDDPLAEVAIESEIMAEIDYSVPHFGEQAIVIPEHAAYDIPPVEPVLPEPEIESSKSKIMKEEENPGQRSEVSLDEEGLSLLNSLEPVDIERQKSRGPQLEHTREPKPTGVPPASKVKVEEEGKELAEEVKHHSRTLGAVEPSDASQDLNEAKILESQEEGMPAFENQLHDLIESETKWPHSVLWMLSHRYKIQPRQILQKGALW
jgi:hypothetical protein